MTTTNTNSTTIAPTPSPSSSPKVPPFSFDRIIFNFPLVPLGYGPDARHIWMDLINRQLIWSFLVSAGEVLTPHGEVHITSKFCSIYRYWRIETLARRGTLLHFQRHVPFDWSQWPGYDPRKMNQSIAFARGAARTYVFAPTPEEKRSSLPGPYVCRWCEAQMQSELSYREHRDGFKHRQFGGAEARFQVWLDEELGEEEVDQEGRDLATLGKQENDERRSYTKDGVLKGKARAKMERKKRRHAEREAGAGDAGEVVVADARCDGKCTKAKG
jgi:hypothetical protein